MESKILFLLAASFLAAHSSVADGKAALWIDEPSMWCAPKTYEADEPNPEGVKSVVIEGEMYKGVRTRFFAWWALPKGASATNRAPGIVLVHGGGGTAFSSWVKLWADRGYAAIAMDTCGGFPKSMKALGGKLRHAYSGPNGWGEKIFPLADDPPKDQWPYHAISTVIRSHSFLRSLPEVDTDRIGLTGISWGGYLTACTAGIDDRFAFAVPVYACAFLKDHSVWSAQLASLGEKGIRWDRLWDARNFLPSAKMPILWVTGSNDYFFPLDSLQRGYDLLPKAPRLAVRVRMPHGHPPAGDPSEIKAFADHFAFGKPALPEISMSVEGRRLSAGWNGYGRKAVLSELIFTVSPDNEWRKREYKALPVPFADGKLSAEIPDGALLCWVNVTFDDGIVASSRHREIAGERPIAAGPKTYDCSVKREFFVSPGGDDAADGSAADPCRLECNWIVPAGFWKIDKLRGGCSIKTPADSQRPDFTPGLAEFTVFGIPLEQ